MVTPYVGLTYGGIAKVVVELVQSLSHVGIQVDVVTTDANDHDTLPVACNTWHQQQGYRIQYFSCWNSSDLILSLPLVRWLSQHLKAYDIVHTHTLFSPIISLTQWLCDFYSIPYIITPHGMLEPWALNNKTFKKKLYFHIFEKHALAHAKAIHTISTAEKIQVAKLKSAQAFLVPNGLSPEAYQALPVSDLFFQKYPHIKKNRIILFLGRIDPKKGLDMLASAFAKVHRDYPDTHLVVAGPDSINYLPTVKEYFFCGGCISSVTFTGMLSGDLKLSALSAASIYVSPSYSEGFSMSVLEGMAAGLPCVLTKGCNFPEAGIANAATIVEMDATSIAQGLTQHLANPEQAVLMGIRAREFIFQNYTWESSARKLKDLYAKVTREVEKYPF